MLITSFKCQFNMQQIYWPTRFSGFSRRIFPLHRISARVESEIFHALYPQQSSIKCDKMVNNVSNKINDQDIGFGLFLTISFCAGDVIAEFHGEVITREQSVQRIRDGNGKYMLYLTKESYLDCRRKRFSGECKASLCNSPLHCWNFITKSKAVANAELVTATVNNVRRITLKAKTGIPRHTEVLANYGHYYNSM
jgi:hypothetical protein